MLLSRFEVLVMSSHLDKEILNLSLEEEDDVPFILSDMPEYYSTARNSLSLVGRLLNPSCQRMYDLILEMPMKWQLYDRVRGVALSKDRFQFIFKYEHDLLDILNRGVHTFRLWPIVLERWVERPPEDYLQYFMVWVQMRNIPSITILSKLRGPLETLQARWWNWLSIQINLKPKTTSGF